MFLELIAAFAAAFAAAGVVLMVNMLTGGRLPRWSLPVAAGAAMLGYAIWSEYTWFARTSADLPAGVEVTFANQSRAMWRPWTYAAPMVNRFIAADTGSIRTNADVPGQRILDLYFFGRWSPRNLVEVVVDCETGRLAPLVSADLDPSGAATEAAWATPPEGDTTLEIACT